MIPGPPQSPSLEYVKVPTFLFELRDHGVGLLPVEDSNSNKLPLADIGAVVDFVKITVDGASFTFSTLILIGNGF